MECKSFALAEVKTMDDADAPGSFEAVVSVFGNVDSYGDRMVKGAFARTLAEKGMPPVVWSHEWSTPPIGTVSSAVETDEGLVVKGRLFVGADEDHAVAKQVYAAMKAGALREFSFGYSTKASNDVKEDGETVREITDVDLFEVGPTLVGANSATRLVGVKALERVVAEEIKAGRVLSAENEAKLSDAHGLVGAVLASVKSVPDISVATTGATYSPNVTITSSGTADPRTLAQQITTAMSQKTSQAIAPAQNEVPEPADKPLPKDDTPVLSEEEAVRIGQLLLERPIHLPPQEEQS